MTGTEFDARDPFSAGLYVAVVFLALFLWAAVGGDTPWGWYAAAAVPAVYLVLRLTTRLPSRHLRLTESGLESRSTGLRIPFDSIRAVTVDGRLLDPGDKLNGPVVVAHEAGELVIPPVIRGARLADLYAHLLASQPARAPQLSPALVSHYNTEVEKFGPERVFAFGVRPVPRIRQSGRGTRICGVSMLIAGAASLAAGAAIDGASDAAIVGGISLMVGLIVWLVGVTQTQDLHLAKKHRTAGMVVSPSSFALSQGPLTGTLRWEEIRRVRMATRGSFQLTSASTRTGIFIEPEGTVIPVADIYTISRANLLRLINSYWRPPAPAA